MAFAVTENFFPLFGVQPLLGRNFLPEEDRPGANKVVMLSHSLWQSRYGGDRNIRQSRHSAQRRKAHGRWCDARELSNLWSEKFGCGYRSHSSRKTWRIVVDTI